MESRSIHPRNWPDGSGEKKNTSKPHKGKGKLGKKLAWLNVRQRDRDATVRTKLVKNPDAFKMPGSMSDRK